MIAADYISRRLNLFESIKSPNSLIIVYGKYPLKRNPKLQYHFSQFSDMIYLTGYTQPGGVLTIQKVSNDITSTLFLPKPNPFDEIYHGYHLPFDEAIKQTGVQKVVPINELNDWIKTNTPKFQQIFCSFPVHQQPHNFKYHPLAPYLDKLRVYKTPKEISLIRTACSITEKAMSNALSTVKPGLIERQIASRFELYCYNHGATDLAYPIVAASGTNATYMHYLDNNCILKEGDCFMMDAGCEYNSYASDYTRTVPIGKVPNVHLELLEMVNDIKDVLKSRTKRKMYQNLKAIHIDCERMLLDGLKGFGVNLNQHQLNEVFPHWVSHFIGIDVHDCDEIPYEYPIKKGTVFSIEPGLYFHVNNKNIPMELRGIGCRFEDTVIIE
ncbi:Clan MG, family M24, aminopeptidase P-like metallopeptidase [Histomonas meleagridis]|uniref:Clan MG, family M24, aminopeptidase P-like metallopeptidase n=1 Tax=Histomonas meleagridis TaxID=135588 RepID=UPI00355972BE|nr:Clan MG, family M24, aminopeptidase P-like metallopeptidase [Histomonas meleagridis]KAH0803765.1 Clan MG, family M24, aminopeptidase P-like metallopeptidase [Histomonas meleagridis]